MVYFIYIVDKLENCSNKRFFNHHESIQYETYYLLPTCTWVWPRFLERMVQYILHEKNDIIRVTACLSLHSSQANDSSQSWCSTALYRQEPHHIHIYWLDTTIFVFPWVPLKKVGHFPFAIREFPQLTVYAATAIIVYSILAFKSTLDSLKTTKTMHWVELVR